jgi:Ca2+-binding EF-hand superfamily protein
MDGYLKLHDGDHERAVDEVENLLDIADVDRNGEIDYTEFIMAYVDKTKLLDDQNLQIAFDTFDIVS